MSLEIWICPGGVEKISRVGLESLFWKKFVSADPKLGFDSGFWSP